MSGRHRKPTASAKKVAKIAFTAAGSQRADDAGSGGRSAGARAGCPLSAMPVRAQYIGRVVQTSDTEIIEVRLREIDNEERVVLVDLVE